MKDWIVWAVGILFTLVCASFAYTNRVDNLTEIRIERSENRVVERIDRLEDRLTGKHR